MDTLSFAFLPAADDVLAKARAEFGRKDCAQALCTMAGLPMLMRSRPDVLTLKAQIHQGLRQWPEAIVAWQELLRTAPTHRLALTQLAHCSEKLRVEEAFRELRCRYSMRRFSEVLQALAELPAEWHDRPERHHLEGLTHERVREYAQALRSWTRLLELDPANAEAAIHLAVCHAALGSTHQAECAARAAAERHPSNMQAQFQWLFFRVRAAHGDDTIAVFIAELARLECLSGNSPEFRAQLDALTTKLSSLDGVGQLLARHLENSCGRSMDAPASTNGSLRTLYESFEPLGGNCEFGVAQRNHGAEPLALFRWTSITPDNLIQLARNRFEGFESADSYRLDRSRSGELILKDTRYSTASHTLLMHTDMSPTALLERMVRRQAFLKRKFMETLAEGSRIFVYKHDDHLPAATIEAMQRALRPLGARKMLFVMRAGPSDQPASVRVQDRGLAVGYLSDVMPNTQFDEWDAIVQRAQASFDGAAVR